MKVVEELTVGINSIELGTHMTRIVYTDDAEMGLSRQLCRGHLNCGLVIVAASSIKEEAFGRGATEDEHLGWAQRHSSYRI